ncbi:MAG: class I SAM-dependent methyltransferase [Bacteroidota bacterium]
MKDIIDNFTGLSEVYKKFRPSYPDSLYEEILKSVNARSACWDCGTGNGQVAAALSNHFESVMASDVSHDQIDLAIKKPNITYSVQRAGQTDYPDDSFDLVTVGQAIHWFDHQAFAKEVRRVSKPEGILAFWGYTLLRVNSEIDAIIDHLYTDITGPYWNKERDFVEKKYKGIDLDFETIAEFDFEMPYQWSLDAVVGFINTWSGLKHYRNATQNDPLPPIISELRKVWKEEETRRIVFPGFARIERTG